MSLDGAYDDQNVFAKILRGEMPSVRVFEDEQVLAFMDVFPQSRGHVLVISKASKARNILEMEPETLSHLVKQVQRIVRAVRDALNPDGVQVMQLNGAPAGQSVFHLHFHIIPRGQGDSLQLRPPGGMADMDELKDLAGQIAAKIS